MSNARIYSNCPGPKVHSASNNFKSPDISDPVPVRAGDGVDIDRCISCAIKHGIQEDGADREARVASFGYRYQASLSFALRQKWFQESVSYSLPGRRHSQS